MYTFLFVDTFYRHSRTWIVPFFLYLPEILFCIQSILTHMHTRTIRLFKLYFCRISEFGTSRRFFFVLFFQCFSLHCYVIVFTSFHGAMAIKLHIKWNYDINKIQELWRLLLPQERLFSFSRTWVGCRSSFRFFHQKSYSKNFVEDIPRQCFLMIDLLRLPF